MPSFESPCDASNVLKITPMLPTTLVGFATISSAPQLT